eukprot:5118390-Amphidinium_carterae.1
MTNNWDECKMHACHKSIPEQRKHFAHDGTMQQLLSELIGLQSSAHLEFMAAVARRNDNFSETLQESEFRGSFGSTKGKG